MVEFAMVLPVFFTFVFGVVEFGRLQLVSNMLTTACRTGARLGSTESVTTAHAKTRVADTSLAAQRSSKWKQTQLIAAFRRIAAKVPPAKLIYSGPP